MKYRLPPHLVSLWPLAVAVLFGVYSVVLLANAFHSQAQLRSDASQRIVDDNIRRAAAIGDAIAERINSTVAMAEAHEIDNYLVNKALGMSLRYGLNANLYAIEERFRRQLGRTNLRSEHLYERIVLFDDSGQILVDLKPEDGKLAPSPVSGGNPALNIDPKAGKIVVSAPVMFKGIASGTVVTVGNLEQLSRDLISSDNKTNYREILLSSDGQAPPAPGNSTQISEKLGKALAKLPQNQLIPISQLPNNDATVDGVLALHSKIPGTDISLITLVAENTIYGQITSHFFLYSASVVPLIALIAAFMFKRIRRVKIALIQSEQRFRTIFDNIRDSILILDIDHGTILEANPRTQTMYGHVREAILKLTMIDLSEGQPPYGTQEWSEKVRLAAAGEPQFFPWHARRCSGELFWSEISMLSAAIDGHQRLLVVAHDITHRKAQEQELIAALEYQRQLNTRLEEAQNQLLQSEKLASIGQLAAGVAHEINNPIGFVRSNMNTLSTYIRDFLALLKAYEQVDNTITESNAALETAKAMRAEMEIAYLEKDVRSLFDESNHGINRVIRIIKDLKDFSHVDQEEKWIYDDLHQGLESTLNVISNELKYKCEVIKEYGELPLVECLISQLNQVFMNLLVNSAHAIETQGTITIRTGCEGELVWVRISDTGKGIPEANLTRIFDPFFTTKPVGQGTGLGLSISHSIIKKHHGSIDVQSHAGEGTTFTIHLPIRQPAADEQTVADQVV